MIPGSSMPPYVQQAMVWLVSARPAKAETQVDRDWLRNERLGLILMLLSVDTDLQELVKRHAPLALISQTGRFRLDRFLELAIQVFAGLAFLAKLDDILNALHPLLQSLRTNAPEVTGVRVGQADLGSLLIVSLSTAVAGMAIAAAIMLAYGGSLLLKRFIPLPNIKWREVAFRGLLVLAVAYVVTIIALLTGLASF